MSDHAAKTLFTIILFLIVGPVGIWARREPCQSYPQALGAVSFRRRLGPGGVVEAYPFGDDPSLAGPQILNQAVP